MFSLNNIVLHINERKLGMGIYSLSEKKNGRYPLLQRFIINNTVIFNEL